MSETTTDEDPIVLQLRIWADDLAAQIPPAAAPTAERGGRRPRGARVLALAASVLVLVAIGAAVVRAGGSEPDEEVRAGTTTTVADVPLSGTSWWLEAIARDGQAEEVPADRVPFVRVGPCAAGSDCEGDDGISGDDGCNSFGGTAEIGPDVIAVGQVGMTAMGCGPGVHELMGDVIRGEVAYVIEGDRLTLRGGDVVATFRAGDGRFPPRPEGATIAEVPGLGPRHRVLWREVGGAIALEVVLFDMNLPDTLTVSLDEPAGAMVAATRPGRRPTFVVGLVDARATTVTFDRQDGDDPSTATLALDGVDDVRAFVVEVPGVSGPWSLTATDGADAVVATYEPPP